MIDFLKNFLTGEKSPEEKALLSASKKRDVMTIGDDDAAAKESCAEEEQFTGCGGPCGCRR